MRVGSLILSYGVTDYLRPCIKQYKWVDKIQVMNYLFPQSEARPDDTPDICKEMGVECESGTNSNQEHVLNVGLDKFEGFDAVFIADSDEFIMQDDQQKLLKLFKNCSFEKLQIHVIDYAKDLYHKHTDRTYDPIVIARPSLRFYEVRCAMGYGNCIDDIKLHHFGFLLSDEKIAWKAKKQRITNKGIFDHLCGRAIIPTIPPDELVELLDGCIK